jgi:bifunctional DNA-binding transcriptional regulator/antitoxin component of YhaV-PrlF toxin-antitoxin module
MPTGRTNRLYKRAEPLVNGEWLMANGAYHRRKLYIPKEIQERLGLTDGDETEMHVLDDRSFTVTVKRTSAPEERIAQRIIQQPFSFALKTPVKREDYYADHGRRKGR